MIKESQEFQFIDFVLRETPSQWVENVASESHETRRLPDPYVFYVRGDKLQTPHGIDVENYLDKTSDLGRLEMIAFRQIQAWAAAANEGLAIWFSPPLGRENEPTSKFIISKIIYLNSGDKVLFNRNIVLDIMGDELLILANALIPNTYISGEQMLRATPLFPNRENFERWLPKLGMITNQYEIAKADKDLTLKIETYRNIAKIKFNLSEYDLRDRVREMGLMGNFPGSCPPNLETNSGFGELLTPFQYFVNHSAVFSEGKTLDCTCPFCKKKVAAIIASGKIKCPSCQKSAPYSC